jgi:hypothetical protein
MSAKKRAAPARADKRFANRSLKKGAGHAAAPRAAAKGAETIAAKAKRTLKTALGLKP